MSTTAPPGSTFDTAAASPLPRRHGSMMVDDNHPRYQLMCAATPLAVICPTCRAAPVRPCRTSTGGICLPHPERDKTELERRPDSLRADPSLMLWIRVELEARARDRFNGGVWGPEQMRCDIDDRSVNLRVEPGGHTIGVDVDGEEPFEITADDAHAGIAHLLHLLDLADQQTP